MNNLLIHLVVREQAGNILHLKKIAEKNWEKTEDEQKWQ